MKKLFLILALIFIGFKTYSNEVNMLKKIPSINWEQKFSDSIKVYLDYETNLIHLNINGYNRKTYRFNNFDKFKFDNAIKFETLAYNEDETIGINMLFYASGKNYIIIKNFKTGGLVKYNLN